MPCVHICSHVRAISSVVLSDMYIIMISYKGNSVFYFESSSTEVTVLLRIACHRWNEQTESHAEGIL